jgi:hypothetical protein
VPVLHDEFFERHIHRSSLPDFADDWQRNRTVLVHILPSESNLQALRGAIVRKAANPYILDRIVFERKRLHEVPTVDDPAPTVPAPVRLGRPVVHFIRFELVEVKRILQPTVRAGLSCRR